MQYMVSTSPSTSPIPLGEQFAELAVCGLGLLVTEGSLDAFQLLKIPLGGMETVVSRV